MYSNSGGLIIWKDEQWEGDIGPRVYFTGKLLQLVSKSQEIAD